MFEFGFKAVAVTGLVMVLSNHVHLDWWERVEMSFGIMMLFGGRGV